jgi:hypothetical protein
MKIIITLLLITLSIVCSKNLSNEKNKKTNHPYAVEVTPGPNFQAMSSDPYKLQNLAVFYFNLGIQRSSIYGESTHLSQSRS